jgi:protein-disulfide isomerase
MRAAAAAFLSVAFLGMVAAAPAAPRKPAAAAVDWTRTVAIQPSGGYRMGNPKAKVRLIEYVSLTCPHCRVFDQEGAGPLLSNYVKTGRVSLETRNFVRDPYDISAALISRCNGARSFFRLTRELLKDQPNWIEKVERAPRARTQALEGLPMNRLFVETAQVADLQKWAAARGIPLAKSRQCLSNTAEINRMMRMANQAIQTYPDFRGTPAFVLNGKLLDVSTWGELEPKLREALGERG